MILPTPIVALAERLEVQLEGDGTDCRPTRNPAVDPEPTSMLGEAFDRSRPSSAVGLMIGVLRCCMSNLPLALAAGRSCECGSPAPAFRRLVG